MRRFFCWILLVFLAGESLAFSYNLETRDKLVYSYELLPSTDLSTLSSAINFYYPVNERSSIELDYLSLNSPILASSSYTITYRLIIGLPQWHFIWPSVLIGYRFIYTPETDFITPLDFGLISEIDLTNNFYIYAPIALSLFAKDNIADASFVIGKRDLWLGDFGLGIRTVQPVGQSAFIQRNLILFGFRNEI